MTPLPDISDLVSRIKGLDGEILRLDIERKEIAKERRLVAQEIINEYISVKVPYKRCNHPKEIEKYNTLDSSLRCGYCSKRLN